MKFKRTFAVAITVFSLSACSDSTSDNLKTLDFNAASSDKQSAVDAAASVNHFTFDLFRAVGSENDDKNIVVSPYSISTAFTMLWGGAKGATADELAMALRHPITAAAMGVHQAFGALQKSLNLQTAEQELVTANRIWGQRDFQFVPDYLSILREQYDAELGLADFSAQPDAEREKINQWVADQTRDKIKDLFSKSAIDSSTRMVLANAVYLKAQWQSPFFETLTSVQAFQTDSKASVQVPMMRGAAQLKHTQDNKVEYAEISYVGGRLSMFIMVPRGEHDVQRLQNTLSAEALEKMSTAAQYKYMDLTLPKFKVETSLDLIETMSGLGARQVFTDAADLSGINGVGGLKVGTAVHKAFINVDEKGTEAAAATGVGIVETGAPVSEGTFTVDRSFVYGIRDSETGSVLFIGRVLDPTI